jgi:hypothetical protein
MMTTRITSALGKLAMLVACLLTTTAAKADSFFDIFVDLWDSGQVVMQPDLSPSSYPFPPPPLDFPPVDTAVGTVDIEIVALSLRSSAPIQISPPSPRDGDPFVVDSFFDVEYQINVTDSTGTWQVDSFFDVEYRMEVTPQQPLGDEVRVFDTEMVSLSLAGSKPLPLPGGGSVPLAVQLLEAQPAAFDGHVTVLKLAGDGNFQVDSFFDIFTEVSLDGGAFMRPIDDGPVRMRSQIQVPEPSSMVLATLLVAGAGLLCRVRR